VTALFAGEKTLGFSISPIDMAALDTFAGGVPRVNVDHGDSSKSGLVFDKACKLVKTPTVVCGPLLLPYGSPPPDTLQFFKGDRGLRVFGLGNDGLADYMVCVCGKTGFFLSSLFEKSLGGYGSFFLKLLPKAPVPATNGKEVIGSEVVPGGKGGDVLYAPVHAEDVLEVSRLRVLDIAGRVQVEDPVNEHEVGFSLLGLQKLSLTLPAEIRDLDSPFGRPDGDELLFSPPCEDAGVVGDGSEKLKLALAFIVKLVGIGNFGNAPDNHLGGKGKLFFHGIISKLMQVVLAENLLSPSLLGDVIASPIGSKQGLSQSLKLLCVRIKFYFSCQLHVFKYSEYAHTSQP